MKVKIVDIDKHRNETTFRPYIQLSDYFHEVGIDFVYDGNDYDMAWIGQASYTNKSKSLSESTSDGLKFLEKFKGQDYILFDGQDSASLIGTWEVFKESEAKLLLKNSLYSEINRYSQICPNGRIYWAHAFDMPRGYAIPLDQTHSDRFSKIKLSGSNWLSTLQPNRFYYKGAKKEIDVFAMFQYPAKENYEFEIKTSDNYTEHRKQFIDALKLLPSNIKVITAETGKVPINQYYEMMSRSKIVLAPFGYGEIAPRDLESCMLGCVLIKPDMSHIQTIPNIFIPNSTYLPCDWDASNLPSLIMQILDNFEEYQERLVEGMWNRYVDKYRPENLIKHIYDIILNIGGYGT